MNKTKKTRLNIAVTVTVITVMTAVSYLIWRSWDYISADYAYEKLGRDAVGHENGDEARGVMMNDGYLQSGNRSGESLDIGVRDRSPYDQGSSSSGQDNDKACSYSNSRLSDMPVVDWMELNKAGEDIVAWLEIPALDIGYPVVQGEDNEYYLHHLPNGEYKKAGSLFMEAMNDADLSDVNTIIYGHNMNNGSMFGKFRDMTQEDIETCPHIWLCTKEKTCLYSICSVHISKVDDASYTLFGHGIVGDMRSLDWISAENARSYLDTPIPKGAGGRMVTLSTCASMSDERRIVQGVLIAEYARPP